MKLDIKYEVTNYKLIHDKVDIDYDCQFLVDEFIYKHLNCFRSKLYFKTSEKLIYFPIKFKKSDLLINFFIYFNNIIHEKDDNDNDKYEIEAKKLEQKEKIVVEVSITNNPVEINQKDLDDFKEKDEKQQTNYIKDFSNFNNTSKSSIEDLKNTIVLNNYLKVTKCSNINCEYTINDAEDKIVEKLDSILNKDKIKDNILSTNNPSEDIIISALSLFNTASNKNLKNSNSAKITNLNKVLIESCPELFENIKQNDTKEKISDIKSDLLEILSSTSSNLISLSKLNSLNHMEAKNNSVLNPFTKENNFNEFKNGSLILSEDNISIKKMVDENSIALMKLKLNMTNEDGEIQLKTKNFIFKGKKGINKIYIINLI